MVTGLRTERVLACAVALVFGLAGAAASAQEPAAAPRSGTAHGPLDGMAFAGHLGPADQPADRDDTLYFGSGHFWSAACTPCGFMPSAYWVRHGADGIHFRGTLESESSGVFRYRGIVHDDGRITVDIHWRKERWYWTIDRDFRFEGKRAEGTTPAALDAVRASAVPALRGEARCDPGRF